MLEENKYIYESVASSILNWRKINKNDLVRDAIQYYQVDENKFNSYFSAIILNYWSKLNNYAYKCKLIATPEDVHEWVVEAIMYAVIHKPWEDPNSSIYQDKNGPDKVINRYIESARITFYQQSNRYKRKINSAIKSLDDLVDDFKDVFMPSKNDEYYFIYHELITDTFKRSPVVAFAFHGILYEGIIDNSGINEKKLQIYLRNLTDSFCKKFAEAYNLDETEVIEEKNKLTGLSFYLLKRKVQYSIFMIKKLLGREDITLVN